MFTMSKCTTTNLKLSKFHDQPRSSQEQDGKYSFFQHRKNNANKYHTKNQPHHYAQNYFPLDDDEYYNQNHQRFSSNSRPRSYSMDQPAIFEPYTQNEQIGQPRTNPEPYNRNSQPQNPVNTHSYQPTQMQNEIPLPYYSQQHEKNRNTINKFFSNATRRRIPTNDYESIPHGWIINNIK